jgi:hypothetical protein
MTRPVLILCVAILFVGCDPKWTRTPGPDIKSSNAMASVSGFIATNGWDMFTNKKETLDWEDLDPKVYITGLPWKAWSEKKFQAKTSGSILYVLLGDEFHHDYYGVAYNPTTNHFPEYVRWFRPIGDHWYVWSQPEFWYGATTDGRYE